MTSSGNQQRKTDLSAEAFARAQRVIPGGVDSPVRAFGAVGGIPPFIVKGAGSKLYDLDHNAYVDYVGSYGPLVLGHADRRVVAAIGKAADAGSSFGAPTQAETLLAERLVRLFPSVQKVRFVSSGTEAVMSALRLARAATGRDLVVKCRGCYHGHVDSLLVAAGSGATTLGIPSSPGVTAAAAAATVLVEYNDLQAAEQVMAERGKKVAAIIVEPVAGNMGVVPPVDGYLSGLRNLCDASGALLIFDEVITGLRVAPGGAQELYGVRPDLTCLGKIIGGGLPVGAYCGPARLMDQLAPLGPVYQAGTLSGNPVAMSAGLATVEALEEPGAYDQLESMSAKLADGLARAARDAGVPVTINRVGSVLTMFFTPGPVRNYVEALASDTAFFARYFHAMLDRGIYLAPSQFEAMFVSVAHSQDDIDHTVAAAKESLKTANV